MTKILNIIRKSWIYITGAILGGTTGYLYWYFIGCANGTCPLKASPTPSIILGLAIGIYISVLINRRKG